MQRWIYITFMVCLAIGGTMLIFLMKMKDKRPDSRWIAMPVMQGLSDEQKNEVVSVMTRFVNSDRCLSEVVEDLQLVKLFNVDSTEVAKQELLKRSFIRLNKVKNQSNNQEIETIDIGVTGIRKEVDLMDKIAIHLGNKVGKMIDDNVDNSASRAK